MFKILSLFDNNMIDLDMDQDVNRYNKKIKMLEEEEKDYKKKLQNAQNIRNFRFAYFSNLKKRIFSEICDILNSEDANDLGRINILKIKNSTHIYGRGECSNEYIYPHDNRDNKDKDYAKKVHEYIIKNDYLKNILEKTGIMSLTCRTKLIDLVQCTVYYIDIDIEKIRKTENLDIYKDLFNCLTY